MLKEKKYRVLGLMSGTSCDGLDIAHCIFHRINGRWHFEIVDADTYAYPDKLQKTLKQVTDLSANELALLDIDLGYFFARQIVLFMEKYHIRKNETDFISSHGHTVFHQPKKKLTLQIGNGEAIYQYCRIPVINNFREADVLAGGQGAPLVPVGDMLLFSDYNFCLNLGGISNISFDLKGERVAFDVGPQNLAINLIANRAGLPMDRGGEIAKKGKLVPALKNELDAFPYYQLPFPKSLGIENLHEHIFPVLQKSSNTNEDILHTLYHHLAYQISKAVLQYSSEKANLLVTGGGAHNQFFIQVLEEYLHPKVAVIVPDPQIINFKEALVFALLGVLRYNKDINILKSVTGASRDSCAGTLHGFQER